MGATHVAVGMDFVTHATTEQLVAVDPGDLPENVPQSDIDPAHRRRSENPVSMPEVLSRINCQM